MSDENGGNGELVAKVDALAELAQEVKQTAIAQAQESALSAQRSQDAANRAVTVLQRVVGLLRWLRGLFFVILVALLGGGLLAGFSLYQSRSNGEAVSLLKECTTPGPRTPTQDDPRTGNACYDRLRSNPNGENPVLVLECQNALNAGLHPPLCDDISRRLIESKFARP